MFQRLGIADAVKLKLRQAPTTMLVADIIASGEADIGFQQANELSHSRGVDYLGPLPVELQETTAARVPLRAYRSAGGPEAWA
jgi:molybdate transport system substrate-binding protein